MFASLLRGGAAESKHADSDTASASALSKSTTDGEDEGTLAKWGKGLTSMFKKVRAWVTWQGRRRRTVAACRERPSAARAATTHRHSNSNTPPILPYFPAEGGRQTGCTSWPCDQPRAADRAKGVCMRGWGGEGEGGGHGACGRVGGRVGGVGGGEGAMACFAVCWQCASCHGKHAPSMWHMDKLHAACA